MLLRTCWKGQNEMISKFKYENTCKTIKQSVLVDLMKFMFGVNNFILHCNWSRSNKFVFSKKHFKMISFLFFCCIFSVWLHCCNFQHLPVIQWALTELWKFYMSSRPKKDKVWLLFVWASGGSPLSCFLCCYFPSEATSLNHQICLHGGLLRRIGESAQGRAFCLPQQDLPSLLFCGLLHLSLKLAILQILWGPLHPLSSCSLCVRVCVCAYIGDAGDPGDDDQSDE